MSYRAVTDEDELRSFGYEQQLDRSMGLVSSFSMSISTMCITAGIFTTYAYALGVVGPAFVWTWPVVAIGQVFVALGLADLAGRMPISGYAFQWTSRLINPHFGFLVGWAGVITFMPGVVGLALGLSPIFMQRVGISINPTTTMVVASLICLSQVALNLAGVRLVQRINNIAAFAAELGLSIVLTAILLLVGFVLHPVQPIGFLTTSSVTSGGFTAAILLSALLAMWVLTGFEAAADLAEETHSARRNVPRAVVTAVCVSGVIGFFMIIALTINIDNLQAATSAPVPIFYVLKTALGETGAILFEAVAMVALYAGGLATVAAISRLLFSMSRDGMLPASPFLAKVNPRTHAPSRSLIIVAVFTVGLVVLGTNVATQTIALIVGMSAMGFYLLYTFTMGAVIYSSYRGRLPGKSAFDLGRWAGPVRWIALFWSIAVVAELVIPASNQQTAEMAGVSYVVAIAWWWFVLRGRINRGEAGTPGSHLSSGEGPGKRVTPEIAAPAAG